MAKARKPRPQTAAAGRATAGGNSSAEIATLQQQVVTLQKEVAALKAQNNKILAFIKKKLA